MPNLQSESTTSHLRCLPWILALGVIGCASKPDRAALDQELRARVRKLETELVEKKSEVKRLVSKLEKKPKVSAHPHPEPAAPRSQKLHPVENADEEEDLDAVVGENEESVTDSRQESLHYYYQGYRELQLRKYEAAIKSLSRFLDEYPAHVYADRAQYLIAEANCHSQEFSLCLLSVNLLETRYPYSLKLDEGKHLKTEALKHLGQKEAATNVRIAPSLLEGEDE